MHLRALQKQIQDPGSLVIGVDSVATAMTHGKYLKVEEGSLEPEATLF